MRKYNFFKPIEDIKAETKEILNGSWWIAAKATALYLFLTLIAALIVVLPVILNPEWYLIVITAVVALILTCLLNYGYKVYMLNLTSNMQTSLKLLFAGFGKKIFKILFLYLYKFFTVLFGFVLLIVYGYIFNLSFSMSEFVLSENPTFSAIDSMKGSKRLMKENKARLSKLQCKNFGWYLLCLTVVGAIWALPYMFTTQSVFYQDLKTDF